MSTPSAMTGLTAGIGTGCVTHTSSSVAGLVARPSGMTGVCTDVTTALVSRFFLQLLYARLGLVKEQVIDQLLD